MQEDIDCMMFNIIKVFELPYVLTFKNIIIILYLLFNLLHH